MAQERQSLLVGGSIMPPEELEHSEHIGANKDRNREDRPDTGAIRCFRPFKLAGAADVREPRSLPRFQDASLQPHAAGKLQRLACRPEVG